MQQKKEWKHKNKELLRFALFLLLLLSLLAISRQSRCFVELSMLCFPLRLLLFPPIHIRHGTEIHRELCVEYALHVGVAHGADLSADGGEQTVEDVVAGTEGRQTKEREQTKETNEGRSEQHAPRCSQPNTQNDSSGRCVLCCTDAATMVCSCN